jgi:hypothetical protein
MLSADQIDHFLAKGHIVLRGCVAPEAVAEYTGTLWTRLGYHPHAPATWTEPSVHMPDQRDIDVRRYAPRAWAAACDLVGGADRISATEPYTWHDGFIVNLREGADRPWAPPSPASPGWHKDGDFFRHFLDSPEQGLLTLVLWSEVRPGGGATFVAADSVGPVARFLADHPEGVHPEEFPYPDLTAQCDDFVEATGEAGDVYLLHPFVLHAKAQNVLRRPRFITNPPLHLAGPMRFDRTDPRECSPVERAVLRGLGVDRYTFTPAAPREAVTPPRIARQRAMREAELGRLAGPG